MQTRGGRGQDSFIQRIPFSPLLQKRQTDPKALSTFCFRPVKRQYGYRKQGDFSPFRSVIYMTLARRRMNVDNVRRYPPNYYCPQSRCDLAHIFVFILTHSCCYIYAASIFSLLISRTACKIQMPLAPKGREPQAGPNFDPILTQPWDWRVLRAYMLRTLKHSHEVRWN